MSEEHWSQNFQHESLSTPEAREAFTSAMSKYPTQEAAVFGGFNAIKEVGKPFKLPKDVSKLDEKTRSEFTEQARQLLGLQSVKSIDDLKDLDLKKGLHESLPVDEELAGSFKDMAVKKGYTKAQIQELIEYHNQALSAATLKNNQTREAKAKEAVTKTNEALVKHFGSEDKVKEQSQLFKQYWASKLSAKDYEAAGMELADSVFTKNPTIAPIIVEHFAKLAAEATTESGDGSKASQKPNLEAQLRSESPKTMEALYPKKK
jgi:hypothetical protein